MKDNLLYDGTHLEWRNAFDGKSLYWRATSGMPGSQNATEQCTKDAGPVPEGEYEIEVVVRGEAKTYFRTCSLVRPSGGGIQSIPRGADAVGKVGGKTVDCDPYWQNWGENRVQMTPADAKTRTACSPRRSGFYIHDSNKGFSHGCIEVEKEFFTRLNTFATVIAKQKKDPTMRVTVKYRRSDMSTYGYTDRPDFVGPIF